MKVVPCLARLDSIVVNLKLGWESKAIKPHLESNFSWGLWSRLGAIMNIHYSHIWTCVLVDGCRNIGLHGRALNLQIKKSFSGRFQRGWTFWLSSRNGWTTTWKKFKNTAAITGTRRAPILSREGVVCDMEFTGSWRLCYIKYCPETARRKYPEDEPSSVQASTYLCNLLCLLKVPFKSIYIQFYCLGDMPHIQALN